MHVPLGHDQKVAFVSVDLGVSVEGASLPKPSQTDSITAKEGLMKRMTQQTPLPDPAMLKEFGEFVARRMSEDFAKIRKDADTSVEAWLRKTHYAEWRKNELREAHERVNTLKWKEKWRHCKSFIKDEFYEEYKFSRTINSRSDEFKVMVGPIFKLIEEIVYKDPDFIKHTPKKDLPMYIKKHLGKIGILSETDFSSFEASFHKRFMEVCEMQVYKYMTSELPEGSAWFKLVHESLCGENTLIFKTMTARIQGKRMSGEMCTSLGNTLTNKYLIEFVCFKQGIKHKKMVEGDDGLINTDKHIDPSMFTALGFTIKLEEGRKLSDVSFCGLVFDETDENIITDPIPEVLTLGWASKKYIGSSNKSKLALLRCKALSLAYSYPGCPILQPLAKYVLRNTQHIKKGDLVRSMYRGMNQYEIEQNVSVIRDQSKLEFREIGENSRNLMSEKYGVDIPTQLSMEMYFDSQNTIRQIPLHDFIHLVKPSWISYYNNNIHYKFSKARKRPL